MRGPLSSCASLATSSCADLFLFSNATRPCVASRQLKPSPRFLYQQQHKLSTVAAAAAAAAVALNTSSTHAPPRSPFPSTASSRPRSSKSIPGIPTATRSSRSATTMAEAAAAAAAAQQKKKQQSKIDSRLIVISGPSGSGKSTILKKLFAEFPDRFGFSVSHTTRSPRAGEVPGRDYHYVDRATFESLIAANAFIEHATYGSNLYGTTTGAVEDVARQGRVCILDIEMEGVKQVANSPALPNRPRFLFLSPPSLDELERRLRGRGTEKEETLLQRLKQAEVEMEFARTSGIHDKIVVNDDLETAYKEVRDWIVGGDAEPQKEA
ncbi:P-loop containing nucleoside triphosphate hydrolase protein [Phyllosticta citricarpa]